jgi:hypothetical protein
MLAVEKSLGSIRILRVAWEGDAELRDWMRTVA